MNHAITSSSELNLMLCTNTFPDSLISFDDNGWARRYSIIEIVGESAVSLIITLSWELYIISTNRAFLDRVTYVGARLSKFARSLEILTVIPLGSLPHWTQQARFAMSGQTGEAGVARNSQILTLRTVLWFSKFANGYLKNSETNW